MAGYIRSPHGIESHAKAMSGMVGAANATDMGHSSSYFTYPEHHGILLTHIVLMTVAWVFVLPISVMFNIARARLRLWAQFAFVAVNALGLFFGMVYNASTPDLYEHNAHGSFGWGLGAVVAVHALLTMISAYSPTKTAGIHPRLRFATKHFKDEEATRLSRDSGQGTEPPSPGTSSPLVGDSSRSSMAYTHEFEDLELDDEDLSPSFIGIAGVDRVLARVLALRPNSLLLRGIRLFCGITDRVVLILGFVALCTGLVVYGGHFKGFQILSGLAHFIKGGIFFWYGLLALGRYLGSFADLGWSWNIRPDASVVGRRKAAAPTPELAESALIFLYGAINVFLEHLGSEDGSWSATDLEHVSISVMFAGGGLFGMMIESSRIRQLLESSCTSASSTKEFDAAHGTWQRPTRPRVSLNPAPAIIIMLLGKMMSGHHQASMTSTMLHGQWGSLFAVAAIARVATYFLMYLAPPTTHQPSRPPSELVVAFCLVSGGLLFMGSNSDFVTGMEMYELDAMFLFTIIMGLTMFLMAWETVVLAAKAWAVRR